MKIESYPFPPGHHSVSAAVANWVRACINSFDKRFHYNQSAAVIAMPNYINRLLSEDLARHGAEISPTSILSEYHGWKIIPGYEAAIVVFIPDDYGGDFEKFLLSDAPGIRVLDK